MHFTVLQEHSYFINRNNIFKLTLKVIINIKRHNLVQITMPFKNTIYTFKIHLYYFKTSIRKQYFLVQNWGQV